MKLRPIYESILNEIGDSAQVPPGAKFIIESHAGKVIFDLLEFKYKIDIRVIIKNENKIALAFDFYANNRDDLTNSGNPLKVMMNIVGCLAEWANRYKDKFHQKEGLEIIYIKYNPKSESDEKFSDENGNKRDRLYRMFIEKFAKKNNSTVTFSTTGGIFAKFNPPLTIQ